MSRSYLSWVSLALVFVILDFFLAKNVDGAIDQDLRRTVVISTPLGQPSTSKFLFVAINNSGEPAFSSSRDGGAFTDIWVNRPTSGTRLVAVGGSQAHDSYDAP